MTDTVVKTRKQYIIEMFMFVWPRSVTYCLHKAVAFVGVSAGMWGGTRGIEAMVPMVRELGLAVTFSDLNFPKVQNTFDSEGKLLNPVSRNSRRIFWTNLFG